MAGTRPPSSPKPSQKDLQAMAKRAQAKQQRIGALNMKAIVILKAMILIITASIASYASQLALAPVYGEIPSSLYHDRITTSIFFAAWSSKFIFRKLGFKARKWLPVLALYTPAIHKYIFQYSQKWGAKQGPIITESATFYPLFFLSILSSALLLEHDSIVMDIVPAALSFGILHSAQSIVPSLLRNHIGSHFLLTRCGLSQLVGGLYAIVTPTIVLLTALPAIFHTATQNTMCGAATPALNGTLFASNYSLLARQESNTGYISVMESLSEGYRVLRCDHSLLGGEWLKAPAGFENLDKPFREPIYAVFVIMEAVRLVDPAPKNPTPRALNIGLGIGTAADGMILHGVETDIVELDPTVYQYAKEYFGLHENHTAYIEDATEFVKRESARVPEKRKTYDYILHDVFTGGAVPAALFTLEVFTGLRSLLATDGVIAINWAGDLKLRAARSIIETIRTVFNNCRVFREELPEEGDHEVDFTNMVIFCTRSTDPYSFRTPTTADFLGSYARERFLLPRYEINLNKYFEEQDRFTILDQNNIGELVDWQRKSAIGHWKIIRTVVPPAVWENY